VFCIHREVIQITTDKQTSETVYGITSLTTEKASPAKLLELARGHWTIENQLHWVRDVTFDEDRSQIRKAAGPRVMATLRNLVISLLRIAGARYIAPAIRECARYGNSKVFRIIGIPNGL
jgi:predicted transposase YbfD/YdcC